MLHATFSGNASARACVGASSCDRACSCFLCRACDHVDAVSAIDVSHAGLLALSQIDSLVRARIVCRHKTCDRVQVSQCVMQSRAGDAQSDALASAALSAMAHMMRAVGASIACLCVTSQSLVSQATVLLRRPH
jgi:hypothetical protein